MASKRFYNCFNLANELMIETAETAMDLIRQNLEVENVCFLGYVSENDFIKGGDYEYLKQSLENSHRTLTNMEICVIFGGAINLYSLKPRHYINLTNYVRELCKLPMIDCLCGKSREECSLKNQIVTYNEKLEIKKTYS